MKAYKEATRADVLADVKADAKRIEWFKKYIQTPMKNKNGKDRKPTFFEAKRAYYEEFYPELTPARKPKQKSFFQEIMDL